MFIFVTNILKHTPWWAFVIFVCLLFIGIRATRDRKIKIYSLAITPIFFLYFYIRNLTKIDNIYISYASAILFLIVVSATCYFFKNTIIINKNHEIIKKGSYSTLICAMITFSVRYFCEYKILTIGKSYIALELLSSGIIGGFSFGKNLRRFIEIKRKF